MSNNKNEKPLSKAKIFSKTKKQKTGKAPKPETVTDVFQSVATEITPTIVEPEFEETEEVSARLVFAPTVAASSKDYKKGAKYYHPLRGVLEYKGIEKVTVQGLDFDTMIFNARSGVCKFPPAKLKAQNIRMLADASFMDEILSSIEAGKKAFKRPRGKGLQQIKICDEALSSGDPVQMASLVVWAFNVSDKEKINASYGNRAIDLLAEEYAAIKKMDFEKARSLFIKKSNRRTGKALLENIESPQASRKTKAQPEPS